MKRKEITKPYVVSINVDSKPLSEISNITTDCKVLLKDRPLYEGEIRSQLNPFVFRGIGFTEFMAMKTARQEWPQGQVIELMTRK
jgi:hypothetical protein